MTTQKQLDDLLRYLGRVQSGAATVLSNATQAKRILDNMAADPTPPGDLPGWRLDWADDFIALDKRWQILDGYHMDNRADVSVARNVTLRDGRLRLAMTREKVTGWDKVPCDYASATVWTHDTYQLPNYFRVQFRIKVPWQQGIWPGSVWFKPYDPDTWTSDGEIDAFELRGQDKPRASQTVHAAGKQDAHGFAVADPDGWHTVVVEKTPGLIRFTVDGTETHRVDRSSAAWSDAAFESGKRWFIWINLQSGEWVGLPDGTTSFAGDDAAMLLDHLYVWHQV